MKSKILSFISLLLVIVATQTTAQTELPLNMPDALTPPLRTLVDKDLESRLKKAVNANPAWAKLVKEKKLAIGLVDLSNPFQARFARINGNDMIYAASLPKIAILLAAMDALDKGELENTGEVMKELHAMICTSSNRAATHMIDLLGFDKIEEVLTDPRYELYDEDYGGGLWVGKRYASAGVRHPDPINGLSHGATVSQVCRFYYMLVMGKLVSWESSKQMLGIMVDPALSHKFVNSIYKIAPEAKVYRKSGTWQTFHADSMLVWGKDPERRYILVALTQDPNGEQMMRKLVHIAEKVLQIKK